MKKVLNRVFIKIQEIFRITFAFFKALYGVFKKEDSSVFESLAPTKNADKDGTYCRALKYAIDNKDIKNIAITGNYGAGKSSVIKTFFEQIENAKYNPIFVSLAAFNKEEKYENISTGTKNKNEFIHTLEKSILQQLFYQASEKELPLSRFKRISRHSITLMIILSIIVILSICTIACICFPNIINIIKNNYYIINGSLPAGYKWCLKIAIAILVITIFIGVYKFLFLLVTKFNISRFKFKNTEVEINNKSESIFNKYLDEIIYFFEVTDHRVVIIEDLDRYDGDATFIFQKLRELNILLNSSKQIKCEVDFIYAIRDDFFKNYEDRTKFFEYIIPIIPISSSDNSNEIIWERLENLRKNEEINYKFDKSFIDDVAILIEDKRVIDNIINEFIIYKNKLDSKYMDDKQLFAMIVYKNIYPQKYSDMQKNRGNIFEIFSNKNKTIEKIIKDLIEDKFVLNDEKTKVKNECLKNVTELKHLLVSNIYNYDKYIGYTRNFKFDNEKIIIKDFFNPTIDLKKVENHNINFYTQIYDFNLSESEVFKYFGNKNNFIERWKNLEKGKDIRLSEIQSEIEKKDSEIINIRNLTMKELINKYKVDFIFENSNIMEKVFIIKGYITENYRDYITLFIPGNLSKKDKEFLFAITTGEKLQYTFKLEKLENIVKELNENDYEVDSILNFDLLDYLLRNNYNQEIVKFIKVLDRNKENELIFIDQFKDKYESFNLFINPLIENSKNLWGKIYNRIGNKDYIDMWVMYYLLNEKALKNTDNNFKEYLSKHEDIDKYIIDEQYKNVINSFEILDIKLENIKKITNKSFINEIYDNNLYNLNTQMIRLMMKLKGVDAVNFDVKNLSIIFNSKELTQLKNYVLNDFEKYYNYCYVLNNSNEDEENVIMDIIRNDSISLDIKENIIKREKFNKYDIKDIDRYLIDIILDEDKLNAKYDNIIDIFIKDNELSKKVINNISCHIEEYILENIDDYVSEYNTDIIKRFKIEYIFNENVDVEDFKTLIDTFKIEIERLTNLDKEKVKYMIDKNIVKFNVDNLEYIKQNIKEEVVRFIIINIESYIEKNTEYDISGYENELLTSCELNNIYKKDIVKNIRIENLSNITLLNLIFDNVISINHEEISIKILNDSDISVNDKINLLISIIENNENKKEVTNYIHMLGDNYIFINTKRKSCSINNTNFNIRFCKILEKEKYISSFKISKNNNNIVIYNKKFNNSLVN